jgi:hypothetical protein
VFSIAIAGEECELRLNVGKKVNLLHLWLARLKWETTSLWTEKAALIF